MSDKRMGNYFLLWERVYYVSTSMLNPIVGSERMASPPKMSLYISDVLPLMGIKIR